MPTPPPERMSVDLGWLGGDPDNQEAEYVLASKYDALATAARAVLERVTPTMEGSVDGDYLGGAVFHSDLVIAELRNALADGEASDDA